MDNYDKKIQKIRNQVSDDLNISIEELTNTRSIIRNVLFSPFSTYQIFGDNVFSSIYHDARNKDESKCTFVSEKIISRSYTISNLKYDMELDSALNKEIEDAKLLWTIVQYNLIPLEQFWCMEHEKDDDRIFSKDQENMFQYLMMLANYYLNKTDKYYKLLSKEKNTNEKSTVQNFDVMAISCDKAFIVSLDKTEEFLNVKPNPEIRQQNEELLKKLNIEKENNDVPVLTKKLGKK